VPSRPSLAVISSAPSRRRRRSPRSLVARRSREEEVELLQALSLDWISYDDALKDVRVLGSGLREHGIGGKGEQFFNIYAATS
jgi:hypothetical protein